MERRSGELDLLIFCAFKLRFLRFPRLKNRPFSSKIRMEKKASGLPPFNDAPQVIFRIGKKNKNFTKVN
jgi:hypothetical protein